MSIPPLRYTFPCPSGIILSELNEERLTEEIEIGLSQLFVGVTYKDEPPKDVEFPTIFEGVVQNCIADCLPFGGNFD